jgi:cobalt-zinc-cadmium efflux system outer membrane protein
MIDNTKVLTAVLAAAVLSGCATIQPRAGFDDVEAIVAERTGARVHWNQGTPADQAVADSVQSLLAGELTADEAVQIALLNNRNLQATYENLSVAQADLVRAGLLTNPIFDAEARFAEGGTGIELGVAQSFIDIFFIPLRRRIAGAAFEGAKLGVAGAVVDLAAQTRQAFYELLADQQLAELRETVLLAFDASYAMAQSLHAAGNVTDLRLAVERAQYEQAKVNLAAARAEVLVGREQLNALMGLWGPDVQWTAATRLPELPPEEETMDLAGLEQRAIANSLDLGVLRQRIMIAGERLGLARPEALIPVAEVGVVGEREPESDWAVGPRVSLPIPIFNMGQAASATARAQLRQTQDLYTAQAVEVRSAVRASATRLTAARERAVYYQAVVLPLQQRSLGLLHLQYNAMQIGVFDLLQARRELVETGVDYVHVLQNYWLIRTQLTQILNGRLSGVDAPMTEPTPDMGGALERSLSEMRGN